MRNNPRPVVARAVSVYDSRSVRAPEIDHDTLKLLVIVSAVVAVCAAALAIGWFIVAAIVHDWSFTESPKDFGVFGDYLGGVLGVLFTGASFVLLIATAYIAIRDSQRQAQQFVAAQLLRIANDIAENCRHELDASALAVDWFQGASVPDAPDRLPITVYSALMLVDAGEAPLSERIALRGRFIGRLLAELADVLQQFDDSVPAARQVSDHHRQRFEFIAGRLAKLNLAPDTLETMLRPAEMGEAQKAMLPIVLAAAIPEYFKQKRARDLKAGSATDQQRDADKKPPEA